MEVVPVRAAAVVHGRLVLAFQRLVVDLHQAALRPFVERAVLEEVLVAALLGGDLAPLCEVPEFVLLHVQMRRGALLVHQLVAHDETDSSTRARSWEVEKSPGDREF